MPPERNGGCATDIIVVRHNDGTLSSTSFHVHLGHKWRNRVVTVAVNDAVVPVVMKVNDKGYAMWYSTAAPGPELSDEDDHLDDSSLSSDDFAEAVGDTWYPDSPSSEDDSSPQNPHASTPPPLYGLHQLPGDQVAVEMGEAVQPVLVPILHQSTRGEEPLRIYAPKDSPSPCASLDVDYAGPPQAARRSSPPRLLMREPLTPPAKGTAPASWTPGPLPVYHDPVPTHKPSPAELEAMQFVYGENAISFTVQGQAWSATASVYYWNDSDRLIISDVDGTITKSDLLGHACAFAGYGKLWIHPGICSLYSSIDRNGYHLVYLTARSMHQARSTRKFLFNLEQGRVFLPKGPLFASPSSFLGALTQEVGRRSHIFKIHCLQDVRRAFSQHVNPFFAAFGNRGSDYIAYTEAGVSPRRIYLLDSKSSVKLSGMKFHIAAAGEPSLLDARFPPRRRVGAANQPLLLTRPSLASPNANWSPVKPTGTSPPAGGRRGPGAAENSFGELAGSITSAASAHVNPNANGAGPFIAASSAVLHSPFTSLTRPAAQDVEVEQEFYDHMFWRIDPKALISSKIEPTARPASKKKADASAASPTSLTVGAAGSSVPSPTQKTDALQATRRRFFFFGGGGKTEETPK